MGQCNSGGDDEIELGDMPEDVTKDEYEELFMLSDDENF